MNLIDDTALTDTTTNADNNVLSTINNNVNIGLDDNNFVMPNLSSNVLLNMPTLHTSRVLPKMNYCINFS